MEEKTISLLASRIALKQEYISVDTGTRVPKDRLDSHKYRNESYMLVGNHKGELAEIIKILEGDIFKYAIKVLNRYNSLKEDQFINVNPSARAMVISKPNTSYIRGKKLRICYNRHTDEKNNQSRVEFVESIEKILQNVPGFKWGQMEQHKKTLIQENKKSSGQKPLIQEIDASSEQKPLIQETKKKTSEQKAPIEEIDVSSEQKAPRQTPVQVPDEKLLECPPTRSNEQFISPVLLGFVDTQLDIQTEKKERRKSLRHVETQLEQSQNEKPKRKQNIPSAIKKKVFNEYCGRDAREGQCFCCKARITSDSFSCAHVLPEKYGGEIDLPNLRPVCVTCNSSMGTMLLHEYMIRQKYELPEINPDEMSWIWLAKAMMIIEKIGESHLSWGTKKDKNEYLKLTNPKKDIRVRLNTFAKAFKI